MYILYETFLYCISWLTVLSWVSCIYLNLFAKASARNAQALQMHLKSGRHRLLSNKFLSHVNTFFNPLWLHTALSKEKNVTVPPFTPTPHFMFFLEKKHATSILSISLWLVSHQYKSYSTVLYLSRSLSLPPPPPPSFYIPVHSTVLLYNCTSMFCASPNFLSLAGLESQLWHRVKVDSGIGMPIKLQWF